MAASGHWTRHEATDRDDVVILDRPHHGPTDLVRQRASPARTERVSAADNAANDLGHICNAGLAPTEEQKGTMTRGIMNAHRAALFPHAHGPQMVPRGHYKWLQQ